MLDIFGQMNGGLCVSKMSLSSVSRITFGDIQRSVDNLIHYVCNRRGEPDGGSVLQRDDRCHHHGCHPRHRQRHALDGAATHERLPGKSNCNLWRIRQRLMYLPSLLSPLPYIQPVTCVCVCVCVAGKATVTVTVFSLKRTLVLKFIF